MKRLFLFAIAVLAIFLTSEAAEFRLRNAVSDFVKSSEITTVKSVTRGFDPSTDDQPVKHWYVLKYDFTCTKKALAQRMDKLTDAYERDIDTSDPSALFNAFLVHDDMMNQSVSIRYSSSLAPLMIEDHDNLMLLSGTERPGVNTIVVVEWTDDGDEPSSECDGSVYIIERDMSYASTVKDTSAKQNSINIQRLAFYATKYRELGYNDSSNAITEATIFVVEDIIRNGTEEEKNAARLLLDSMVAEPLNLYYIPVALKDERVLSQQALVNLLYRLDSESVVRNITSDSFSIEGTIDAELWDIGYNIRTSAEDLEIVPENVATIKAVGKKFYYDTTLRDICVGQLNALLKDGTEINASIRIPFVPGQMAVVNVHNGWFSLGGSDFYTDYTKVSPGRLDTADKQIAFAEQHIDRPGMICALFMKNIVTDPKVRARIFDMLSDEMKEGMYGRFLRKFL